MRFYGLVLIAVLAGCGQKGIVGTWAENPENGARYVLKSNGTYTYDSTDFGLSLHAYGTYRFDGKTLHTHTIEQAIQPPYGAPKQVNVNFDRDELVSLDGDTMTKESLTPPKERTVWHRVG